MLSSQDIARAYSLWLNGLSLRKLARIYGISHTTIHSYIKAQYGIDACNLGTMGLARSVITDYPEHSTELLWALRGKGHAYSQKTIKMYSRYQVGEPGYMDNVAYLDETYIEPFRLPMFTWFVDQVTKILHTVKSHVQDVLPAMQEPARKSPRVWE